jgi:hypothetical protein
MFNNKGESQMEKTILVVKRFQYSTKEPSYNIEKSAQTLEEAMTYKVALESLNNDKDYTFVLFNELGQFDIETIEKKE